MWSSGIRKWYIYLCTYISVHIRICICTYTYKCWYECWNLALFMILQLVIRLMKHKWKMESEQNCESVIDSSEWRGKCYFIQNMTYLIMQKTNHKEFIKQQFQIVKEWFVKETCTHIELLHTKPASYWEIQKSSQMRTKLSFKSAEFAFNCNFNCNFFYPHSFLTLWSLHNLYANPTQTLMYTTHKLQKTQAFWNSQAFLLSTSQAFQNSQALNHPETLNLSTFLKLSTYQSF